MLAWPWKAMERRTKLLLMAFFWVAQKPEIHFPNQKVGYPTNGKGNRSSQIPFEQLTCKMSEISDEQWQPNPPGTLYSTHWLFFFPTMDHGSRKWRFWRHARHLPFGPFFRFHDFGRKSSMFLVGMFWLFCFDIQQLKLSNLQDIF